MHRNKFIMFSFNLLISLIMKNTNFFKRSSIIIKLKTILIIFKENVNFIISYKLKAKSKPVRLSVPYFFIVISRDESTNSLTKKASL